MIPLAPRSTLFPYTTLFRSNTSWRILQINGGVVRVADAAGQPPSMPFWLGEAPARSDEMSAAVSALRDRVARLLPRSEEHTSELQSLRHLVCRLLLEKKKI